MVEPSERLLSVPGRWGGVKREERGGPDALGCCVGRRHAQLRQGAGRPRGQLTTWLPRGGCLGVFRWCTGTQRGAGAVQEVKIAAHERLLSVPGSCGGSREREERALMHLLAAFDGALSLSGRGLVALEGRSRSGSLRVGVLGCSPGAQKHRGELGWWRKLILGPTSGSSVSPAAVVGSREREEGALMHLLAALDGALRTSWSLLGPFFLQFPA